MPPSERVQQLQQELNELQSTYASNPNAGGGGSAAVSQYYDMMRDGASQAGQTSYERFLQQRNQLNSVRAAKGPTRSDMVLLKDGLDMSLYNMLDDAARMQHNLTEWGLALGEGRRANIQNRVENAAIPKHISQQFTDQQRVLVDQRRQLEQLRQEKQQAEVDQKWLKRDNAARFHNWNPTDPSTEDAAVPINPTTLNKAHEHLRRVIATAEGKKYGPPVQATPVRDGYLLADFIGVSGFSHRQLYDATWVIEIRDKSGGIVAQGAAEGPRNKDGTFSSRQLQMTIPGELAHGQLDVKVKLIAADGSGSAEISIPFSKLGENRAPATSHRLTPVGTWEEESRDCHADLALSAVLPEDASGKVLAQTRAQKYGVTGIARSHHQGPELPPSQTYLRNEAADWKRRGCPIDEDEIKVPPMSRPGFKSKEGARGVNVARQANAGGGIGRVQVGPKRPAPLYDSEPEPPRSEEEPEPQDDSGWLGTFFAAGSREDSVRFAEEPEPMPQPRSQNGNTGRSRSQPQSRRRPPPRSRRSVPSLDDTVQDGYKGRKVGRSPSQPFAAFSGFRELDIASNQPKASSSAAPVFAAFAGSQDGLFGGLFGGATDEQVKPKIKLKLRPPSSSATLQELYVELRASAEEGKLGSSDAAQELLEFAARAAQPGLLEDVRPEEGELSKYAGLLMDGLDAYPGQEVIAMGCVDGLVAIFRCAGRLRSQLGVPIFSSFARASYNFQPSDELDELHNRLLAGLATTASPDCLASPKLVDYILEQLESKMARAAPLTAEHALAVLCAVRSSHRLGAQIFQTLFLLRAFKSDAHLSTRMLVTLAELYEVMRDEILREVAGTRAASDETVPTVDAARVSAFDRGAPKDGSDLRLTMTILDLYPHNRKVAGSAVRAFAAMSKLTPQHLQAVMVDELRGLSASQKRHASSRSVNFHCAEVVREAAVRDSTLISKGAILLAGSAQRAFPQDQEVVQSVVEALRVVCDDDRHKNMLIESVPASELVKLGEAHCANPRIIESILHILTVESFDNVRVRDELIRCSAVAVPLRALDLAWTDAKLSAKALECIKRLTFRSRDAVRQVSRAGGIQVIWSVLQRHQKDASVVREALSAIAGVAKHPKSRLQLVNIWNADTLDVLDQMLHIAGITVSDDADVVTQACCAIGTLTSYDDEQVQKELRDSIDQELLQQVVTTAYYNCKRFVGMAQCLDICSHLFQISLRTELYANRILTEDGALCVDLPSLNQVADLPDPLELRNPPQSKVHASERVGQSDTYDIFGPLRSLGVGAQDQYEGKDADKDLEETVEEPEAEGGLLAAIGLGGGDPNAPGFLDGGSFFG